MRPQQAFTTQNCLKRSCKNVLRFLRARRAKNRFLPPPTSQTPPRQPGSPHAHFCRLALNCQLQQPVIRNEKIVPWSPPRTDRGPRGARPLLIPANICGGWLMGKSSKLNVCASGAPKKEKRWQASAFRRSAAANQAQLRGVSLIT